MKRIPLIHARGRASEALRAALLGEPGDVALPALDAADPVHDEDLQACLLMAYELHYAGWADVDPAWEWQPSLLAALHPLEDAFEAALRALAAGAPDVAGERTSQRLFAAAEADESVSLSRYVQRDATVEQAAEYLLHRSLVQLKEADAQTWLVPRLRGRPQGVLIEVQADEYGGGDLGRMHSRLWAQTMRGLGLDDREGSAAERLPAVSLAVLNAQTMCGIHARLAPVGVGFFTMVEITSSVPMRRYARGFERLGFGEEVTRYFTEHVTADATHEQLMARELVDAWVAEEPAVGEEIMAGARVCLALDGLLATHCVDAWQAGRSSLRAS